MGHTFTFAPLPVPNGYDVLLQAATLYVEPTEEQMQALARKDIIAQRAFVAANQDALGVLQQGLQIMGRVPPPTGVAEASDLEAYNHLRGLTRLLAAQSSVQTADGDVEGASNTAIDSMWFSRALAQGGGSLAVLTGISTEGVARAQLWAVLPKLNAEQTHLALDRLRLLERVRAPLADTLRVEQFFGLQQMQKVAEEIRPDAADALQKAQQIADQVYEFWEDEIKASAQPYNPERELLAPSDETRPARNMGEILRPVVARTRTAYERNRTLQSLLLVGLALRAYQLNKGTLPDALEQLTPDYLPKPLTDALGLDVPFHYTREGATFTLYSVGPDGKDDGGQALDKQTQKGDLLAPLHTFAA